MIKEILASPTMLQPVWSFEISIPEWNVCLCFWPVWCCPLPISQYHFDTPGCQIWNKQAGKHSSKQTNWINWYNVRYYPSKQLHDQSKMQVNIGDAFERWRQLRVGWPDVPVWPGQSRFLVACPESRQKPVGPLKCPGLHQPLWNCPGCQRLHCRCGLIIARSLTKPM